MTGRRTFGKPPSHLSTLAQQAQEGFLAAQNQGIPLNQPLVSNQRLGSFWVTEVSVPISGGLFPHKLGRIPTAVIVVDNRTSSTIYRTQGDVSLATPSEIFLRSGPSATVAMVLIG